MDINIDVHNIEGEEYLTVKHFSALANRSDQTIYNLVNHGNSIRKLKSIKIGRQVLIPVIELKEFPFTAPGKQSKESIYHIYEEDENE